MFRRPLRTRGIPYGYDLSDDGISLIPNESEQAVIADIWAMRARGMKLKQIAGALSDRGVPTKTGKSQRWTHQAVRGIRVCSPKLPIDSRGFLASVIPKVHSVRIALKAVGLGGNLSEAPAIRSVRAANVVNRAQRLKKCKA